MSAIVPGIGSAPEGAEESVALIQALYHSDDTSMPGLNPRITVEPGKMGGKPCIRGLRFTVYDLASYLASGMTEDDILKDFPYLEKEDFQAVYEFFASIPDRITVLEATR
jgi:uncharacterized protein (DUF433 family)